MFNRKDDKKFRLPICIYLLYLIVASLLITGVAFSKYVTSDDASDNARLAKFGDIIVSETGDIVSTATENDTTRNSFIIIPGVDIAKDVRLRFEGAEVACYVFMQVTPNGFTVADDHRTFTESDSADSALSWAIDNGWTYLTAKDGTYVYYTAVQANDAIASKPVIKDGVIHVSENLKRSDISNLPTLLNIGVKGTAVQIDGNGHFDTEEERVLSAWNSVSSY